MNKASEGDKIPAKLFQILKDDSIKAIHSICQHILKAQQQSEDWRRSVFISIQKKGNAKECSNYLTIGLISHATKVMLKILQARLQKYVNQDLPDVQAGFRKGRGTRDQIAISIGSQKKQGNSRKISTSALLTILKPLIVGVTTNCGKFLKSWEYKTTLPASCKTCIQIKKQQLEPDMEQVQTMNGLVPNWERSMSRLYIVTLLI